MQTSFTSNEIFSVKWLGPVLGLVQEHNFEDAFTLAEYYPASPGRYLVQIASLLGQYARILSESELKTSRQAERVLDDCESIARNIKDADRQQAPDFANLVNELSPRLLGDVYRAAFKSNRFHLAQLCLASMGLSNRHDSTQHAIEWLHLAQTCFAHKEVDVCEFSLKHLFSLQYDAASVIQHFSGAHHLRTRYQLMLALQEKGFVLSQERSAELLGELLKTDLELKRDDIDKVSLAIEAFSHNSRVRVGEGLAHQVILIVQRICSGFDQAEARLNESFDAIRRVADSEIDTKQLVSYLREIEEIIRHVERPFELAGRQREALVFRIRRTTDSWGFYLHELDAIQSLLYDLERILQVPKEMHSEGGFDREIRVLHLLARSLDRDFVLKFLVDPDSTVFQNFHQIADAIENIRTACVPRLPQELTNLVTNLKRTRVEFEKFINRSLNMLQDPISYTNVVSQLPGIRQQEEVVQQEFFSLNSYWSHVGLRPLRRAFLRLSEVDPFAPVSELARRSSPALAYSKESPEMAPSWSRRRRTTGLPPSAEPPLMRTVERYTKILFPETCMIDQKVELRIQLTKKLPMFTRMLKKLSISVGIDVEVIEFTVIVTAPGFALQQAQQPMLMTLDGDSHEVVFNLYAAERGDQIIEVEFFYESSRVGHVLIKTHVGYGFEKKTTDNIALLKDPVKALHDTPPAPLFQKHVLHVTWMSRAGELHYKLPGLHGGQEWKQSAPDLKSEVEDSLRELNAFLTEAVSSAAVTKEQWAGTSLNLKGKGKYLFDTLIPTDLAALIASWERDSILAISTNEQWIPWELMFDGHEFLGRKHMLTRYPRPNEHARWPDKAVEHNDSRVIQKILNVIGGGLKIEDSTRAFQLFDSVASRIEITKLREEAVAQLSTAIATADVLHCTCHGLLKPHLLLVGKDSSRTQNLAPETIRVLPLQAGSLVFVNACSSAAAALLFGSFNSFGWEFYLQGAEVFIGTLGAVPTKYAIEHAENIYAHLFNTSQSLSIGQALARAREEAEKKQNIFWLLYCVYGDPDYSVRFK